MSHLVVLNLGIGNCQQGLSAIAAQIWTTPTAPPIQVTGSLPPCPELSDLYTRWQRMYTAVYAHLGQRLSTFEVDDTDVTHVSRSEFTQISQEFSTAINRWLSHDGFQRIDRQLRTGLSPLEDVRLVIVANDPTLLKLPWRLWQFFDDYPRSELALSPPDYGRSPVVPQPASTVNVLAILGNRQGIDIEHDRQILEQLPHANVTFLVEPDLATLSQTLWQKGWDVFFFAGHSSSHGKGTFQVNSHDNITIDELKYGLRYSITQGLKLAIFNSCDGLGLAQDLATLNIPQVIVMRESVPDRVAQEFLKHFLTAFSRGETLYLAVREAREKLQGLETNFPCATWLPVICQNPAEVPPLWQDWYTAPKSVQRRFTKRSLLTFLGSSLILTGLVNAMRWAGWLQPWELSMYDWMMRSRPIEPPDRRFLIVAITESDIQAQGNEPRQGTVSDRQIRRAIEILEKANPRAIGIDIYRDFPASDRILAKKLQTNNRLFTICKRSAANELGIKPAPESPISQVGFSDFTPDPDYVLRRHLIALPANPTKAGCTTPYALSVLLALRYLADQNIKLNTDKQEFHLGKTQLYPWNLHQGGYHNVDMGGAQLLINYRNSGLPSTFAQQVTLSQLLNREVNPNAIRDRIVLIGIAAPASQQDYWATPYGQSFGDQVPGVVIQGQKASQLISAVLDGRSLIWAWPALADMGWIGIWVSVGSAIGLWIRRSWMWSSIGVIASGTLVGVGYWILLQGGWIPVVPGLIGLPLAAIAPRTLGPRIQIHD